MPHHTARFVFTVALGLAAAALLSASMPVIWQVSTRADFLKGDVENLSVDNDGRLSLGPATSLVHDSAAPFLWTLLRTADDAIVVGSGNDGKVFRVEKDGRASILFDAVELEIHALALAPNGGVYVAASPDGQIYKVDAKGTATAFFKPDAKYIWALAVDGAGNVFAGTGEKGVIYKITPDGTGTPFYKTRSTNVVALAFDPAGNLLAGTESPGRVFRIDREGRAFVLLESAFREVHSMVVDAVGTIFATAVAARPEGDERPAESSTPEPPRAVPIPMVSTEITSVSMIDTGAAGAGDVKPSSPRGGPRGSKGAVYRIAPDGGWDTVWESSDDTPYDVAIDGDDGVLIGTGHKGKIFRVIGDPPRVTLVGRAAAQQVTRFLRLPSGETLYATANPGRLFRLSAARADRGTYESEVRDAQTVSTWGTISWRGTTPPGSQIEVRTRSGNSQTPDDTWSPWSAPYAASDGQPILSPKARYLQWKATLTGQGTTPTLTSVAAAYLQRNLRPRVVSITVYPPGVVFQKPFSTGEAEIAGFEDGWPDTKPSPAALAAGSLTGLGPPPAPSLGRRIYQKGLQGFAWRVEDDNDDKLEYDVLYRRESETGWKTLKRGLSEALFVWETTSVPNGTYLLRIVASDAPSNAPGAGLTGEADSVTFDIDNAPPLIRTTGTRREAGRTVVSFEVRDDQSAIQRVDYSVDAGRWRPVPARDGIYDSRAEQCDIAFDDSAATIVIRAIDAMGNVATTRLDGLQRR